MVLAARSRTASGAAYWLAIVAIRTLGTNFGDSAAEALGLAASTASTGVLLVAQLRAAGPRAAVLAT